MWIRTNWLTIGVVLALILSGFAVTEGVILQRHMLHVVGSDTIVVPARMDVYASTAGIAPSINGDDIVLWLGRLDSGAQTRVSVNKTGKQSVDFYDIKGRLRLTIGLDNSGHAHMSAFDEHGKPQPVDSNFLTETTNPSGGLDPTRQAAQSNQPSSAAAAPRRMGEKNSRALLK